jgi:YhcH/YjgK/YiaL family protein
MIFDHISNLADYNGVGRNIKKFTNYITPHDITAYEPGKYIIDDDVFFTVKCYEPRRPEQAGWEAHREYIDIQYVIEGRELMGIMPISQLQEKSPYDLTQDKITYEPSARESVLRLGPGMFALLLPQDAHHPTIIDGEVTHNKKAVVKIRV